jgi:Na+-translocating ferredoxin:NAD+ oxidoreductase RNF subunit RnfB
MEKPEKREQKDDVEAEIEDERSIKLLLEKHLVEVAELRQACKVRAVVSKKKSLFHPSPRTCWKRITTTCSCCATCCPTRCWPRASRTCATASSFARRTRGSTTPRLARSGR